MRILLSALAVSLFALFAFAAPQNALACHNGTPHGSEASCDGGGTPTSRIVFVTSDHYDSALEPRPLPCVGEVGVSAGDCICEYHADQAGLDGTFLAWLSDSNSSPAADFVKSTVPYVRPDGVMVASSWEDLTDTTILAPIEVNELGGRPRVDLRAVKSVFVVWTGTAFDGTSTGFSCGNGTNAPEPGAVAAGDLIPETACRWTRRSNCGGVNDNRAICDQGMHHLYCFEQ